jgi:hypothetical protein
MMWHACVLHRELLSIPHAAAQVPVLDGWSQSMCHDVGLTQALLSNTASMYCRSGALNLESARPSSRTSGTTCTSSACSAQPLAVGCMRACHRGCLVGCWSRRSFGGAVTATCTRLSGRLVSSALMPCEHSEVRPLQLRPSRPLARPGRGSRILYHRSVSKCLV